MHINSYYSKFLIRLQKPCNMALSPFHFVRHVTADLFFLPCRVRTLDAFIPHSPTAHTTSSCLSAALSSYRALKEADGESRGVLFFRVVRCHSRCERLPRAFFFFFKVVCRFTQYLSACVTVCDGRVHSADCPTDTRTQTCLWHLRCCYFLSQFL